MELDRYHQFVRENPSIAIEAVTDIARHGQAVVMLEPGDATRYEIRLHGPARRTIRAYNDADGRTQFEFTPDSFGPSLIITCQHLAAGVAYLAPSAVSSYDQVVHRVTESMNVRNDNPCTVHAISSVVFEVCREWQFFTG